MCKVERLSVLSVFQEHECVRSVGFDPEVVGKGKFSITYTQLTRRPPRAFPWMIAMWPSRALS
jgi:hypothetical protein